MPKKKSLHVFTEMLIGEFIVSSPTSFR
jgi:hypothetical protein